MIVFICSALLLCLPETGDKDSLFIKEQKLMMAGSPAALVSDYSLGDAFPNPFNPSTEITFSIPVNSDVEISVYSTLGEKIVDLVQKEMDAGRHSIVFNATGLNSGLYIVRMQANESSEAIKVLFIK